MTGVVLLSAAFARSPLRDAATGRAAAAGAHLVTPPLYLLFAPVCDVMDALSLLSVPQTIATVATLAIGYVLWRIFRWRSGGALRPLRELRLLLRALGLLVAFYGLLAVAPRPMAALRVTGPTVLVLDVHSHTDASHDGRPGFGWAANRAWHTAAGFDAAYITDHRSFDGAEAGVRHDRLRAGGGGPTVLLSGIEYVRGGEHLNALGATERNSVWRWIDLGRAHPALAAALGEPPVIVETVPANLDRVPLPDARGWGGAEAIEISDGSPRGIAQCQRDHARILHIADSLDLALVAGSDNHGWGRTAVAWTLLSIPHWRALSPAALGAAIQHTIRTDRRRATQVVQRRSPDPGRSRIVLALTLPAAAWNLFATLSVGERVSWVVWAWLIALAVAWQRGEQEPRS